jgi:hypothetical protein
MQTVFPGAVTSIEVDDPHGMIAATGPGRVVLFKVSVGKLGKSCCCFFFRSCSLTFGLEPLQCLLADPPFTQDPRLALAISTHFFQKGKSILVCYLDSHEM